MEDKRIAEAYLFLCKDEEPDVWLLHNPYGYDDDGKPCEKPYCVQWWVPGSFDGHGRETEIEPVIYETSDFDSPWAIPEKRFEDREEAYEFYCRKVAEIARFYLGEEYTGIDHE